MEKYPVQTSRFILNLHQKVKFPVCRFLQCFLPQVRKKQVQMLSVCV